jgi:diguanylate cyclase
MQEWHERNQMSTSLMIVAAWVLASVTIGLCVGFYLGRTTCVSKQLELAKKERESALKTLISLLESTAKLTSDVDSHNTELVAVGKQIEDLALSGELEDVQQALLRTVGAVLEANHRLEEDLHYTSYRVEEQAEEIDRTRAEARTDALSGVANRKAFDEKLQYLTTNWKRTGEPFALVIADVDHFKWINDTHGHPAGDRVVQHVGNFLKSSLRNGDFVARYGGDEFAILLPQTDLEIAAKLAERLRVAITRNNFDVGVNGERAAITFSMGVAASAPDTSAQEILRHADEAVYQSKRSGRNCLNVYRPAGAVQDEPAQPELSADETTDTLADSAA